VRRPFVLVLAMVFIGGLGGLTVIDFVQDGVTGIGILSIVIIVFFSIGIVGSLLQRPRR
jgi:hypothetical protein